MATRLEILKASLEKKNAKIDEKFGDHFATVKQANGQPLNDKRNGAATLAKWERQSESIRTLQESIQKTESAIEREEWKADGVRIEYDSMPEYLRELIDNGTLTQWRKNPNTMFVTGVKKARLVWREKGKIVCHRYADQIESKDEYAIFRDVFNGINSAINNAPEKPN